MGTGSATHISDFLGVEVSAVGDLKWQHRRRHRDESGTGRKSSREESGRRSLTVHVDGIGASYLPEVWRSNRESIPVADPE